MLQHHEIDLGSVNQGPARSADTGPRTLIASPSYRTLIRESTQLMLRGMDPRLALLRLRPCIDSANAQIAANATLRKDEWILFDNAVQPAYQETLMAVGDLIGRGLRLNLANPFGTPIVEAEKISEMTEAQVSMYAGTAPENDRVSYDLWGVPVPVISKGFWLDERVLEASRMRGQTLDTTNADAATRVVSEKLESLLFNGGPTYGGYTLYGYLSHPDRNTGSLSGPWDFSGSPAIVPSQIIDDVTAMKAAAYADNVDGPFVLYVPRAWSAALDRDYVSGTPSSGLAAPTRSILARIREVDGIADVKFTKQLTSSVVLVDMTRRTVDVVFGFEPRLIQWESQGGMVNHFRVLSIMSFRTKSDYAGRSGIAVFS